jgi:gamma-glutamyltranspeptidase/glutathione hydrolase
MKAGAPNSFGLVQGAANAIAPGKRMLSSMSPTIVVRDGKLRAVVGSPGGATIITTVAQILLQLIDYQQPLRAAIATPRFHHQWLPDQIVLERGLPKATLRELERLGHTITTHEHIGHAHCIELDSKTGMRHATADVTRGGGGAVAY